MTTTTLPTSPSSTIRTPDQRLRVFLSSTLQELAPERRAAREAIEKLRLTPVMFELGARPHPPRDLYRAYLQQSQVFVGVYWERYGWVAPGETVSGLEDEYALSGTLPKLIYIKASKTREPRLDALLGRVRSDNDASYKTFSTPVELSELLADDLALLLTERFEVSAAPEGSRNPGPDVAGTGPGHVPVPLTALIGREAELAAVQKVLERGDVRLVTLVGSGGIGKTRLALAIAAAWAGRLPQGVRFVSLVDARDRAAVLSALARAFGLRDSSGAALQPDLQRALAAQKVLLILDNFEQVLDAAPLLSELLSHAPGIKALVTSRSLLRVGGEHSVEVGPLALPELRPLPPLDTLRAVGSVRLFVERARAVKPDFELTLENAESVARLCLALDGAPLAIELAAARVRVLPPAAMLARLEQRLPLLTGGAQDLPARQRTLRDTIDWSVQLLSEGERRLFTHLGVFARTFTLEAAEAVCGDEIPDVLGRLSALVDSSLVQQDAREEEPSFSWLWTVREYALERLGGSGEQVELQRRHADYFHTLALGAPAGLIGAQQSAWLGRLDFQYDNLRATMRHDLGQRDYAGAAQFGWNLYVLWWVGGHLGEIRGWMEEVLAAPGELPRLARAQALYFAHTVSFWQMEQQLGAQVIPGLEESAALFVAQNELIGAGFACLALGLARFVLQPPDVPGAVAALEQSLSHFRASGHAWGEGMALLPLGRVALMTGDVPAAERDFRRSLELTQQAHDELGISIALNHLGWTAMLRGDEAGAKRSFRDGLEHSARLQHDEGVAYGLEGLLAVAAMRGDAERAARLLGALETRRTQLGLHTTVNASYYLSALNALRARPEAAHFADDEAAGAVLSLTDALSYALESAAEPAAPSTGAPHDPTPA